MKCINSETQTISSKIHRFLVSFGRTILLLAMIGIGPINSRVAAGLLNVTPAMLSGPLNFFASPPIAGFAAPIPYGFANNDSDSGWIWPTDNSGLLQVDFGSPTNVTRIRVYVTYPGLQRGVIWAIEGSEDATTWISIVDFPFETSLGGGVNNDGSVRNDYGGWYGISFNATGTAYRYWRVRQDIVTAVHQPRAGQMEFYSLSLEPSVLSTSPSGRIFNPGADIVVALEDQTTAVDTNSIHLFLNGSEVLPSINKPAGSPVTTISYDPPGNLPSGTNTVRITFSNDATPSVSQTNQYSFVVTQLQTPNILSFRADDPGIVTDASGNVARWPNQPSGGADAIPFGENKGPIRAKAVINANAGPRDVLRFFGSQFLETPVAQFPTGSLFIVMKTSDPALENQRVVGWGHSDTGQDGLDLSPRYNGGVMAFMRNNGAWGDIFDAGNPNVDYEVITVTWGPDGTSLHRNGVLAGTGSLTSLSSDPNIILRIGATGLGSYGAKFRGDILELRIYDQQLVEAARATVETELSNRWFEPGPVPLILSTSPTGRTVNQGANIVVELQDQITAVDTNSIHLFLNGSEVLPWINKPAGSPVTTISYDPPGNLPFGTNTVRITFSNDATPSVSQTNQYSFVIVQPRVQGADGLLVLEAEHFDDNTPGGGQSWTFTNLPPDLLPTAADTNVSGSGCMFIPNAGNAFSYNPGDMPVGNPQMDYRVYFTTAGSYRVWVRGAEGLPIGGSDSVNLGLDGVSAYRINAQFPQAGGYVWGQAPTPGGSLLTVATTGLHVFNIWMREDGFAVDKVILTQDLTYTPTGLGPNESPRADQLLSIARAGNDVVISWPGLGTLQSADEVTGPWTDVVGAASPQSIPPSAARQFYRLRQ